MGVLAFVAIPAVAAIALLAASEPGHVASPAVAGRAPSPSSAVHGATPAASRVVVRSTRRSADGIELVAAVRGARARIVAVTFWAGSQPLGTDTTAPFRIDVVPSSLPAEPSSVHAIVVDRFGHRSESRSVRLPVPSTSGPTVSATPDNGFSRALETLHRGHATVRLGPGRYAIGALSVGSDTRLIGAGSKTVLVPRPGSAPWAVLNTAGRHIRIADLAVDGDHRAGRAVSVAGGSDVLLQRLWLSGVRENGVEIWGVHRDVSVQDSVIDGRGATNAGVLDRGSDDSRDVSVVRSRIFGFRGYGVLFAQRFYGRPAAALHNLALDNDISDIFDPTRADGTDEGGIWSGGVAAALIGNRIRSTGIDGIETVGSSTRTTIVANRIASTPVGIYLEHSTNAALIARNDIRDVGTGINVEWRHAGGGSSANTFAGNAIVRAARAGLFVDVGSDANRIEANRFVGGARPAIVLQGASGNLVRANVGCRAVGRLIAQQPGRWEQGSLAASRRNRLFANVEAASCAR